MEAATILRVIIVLTGVFYLGIAFYYYARRKLTETIGLGWGGLSVLMILSGSLPLLSRWADIIDVKMFTVAYLLGFFMLLCMFCLCIAISALIMKTQELAIQVTLLNQENERMIQQLQKLGFRE